MHYPYRIKGTSKYTGVCYLKRRCDTDTPWQAICCINGTCKHIGYYSSEYEAAIAYNRFKISKFGKFTITNLIEENDKPDNFEFNCKHCKPITSRTSKFRGVYFNKSKNEYIAKVTYNKQSNTRAFPTELEAAYYWNKETEKINKLYGEKRKLNYLNEYEIAEVESINKYYAYKEGCSSIYMHVYIEKNASKDNQWRCAFTYNGKRHVVGSFPTDKEAAEAYNKYITINKINKKLNRIKK